MADPDLEGRRQRLNDKLSAHEAAQKALEEKENTTSFAGYAAAFRMSTEFISGIIAGGLIGFGADWLFGTTPWLLIVFMMLGFAAGVMNVLRSAGLIQKPQVGHRPRDGDAQSPPE